MASVDSNSESTLARQLLDFALGEKRISLGDLSSDEFDKLLRQTLNGVDLRELRGFVPLKDFLTWREEGVSHGRYNIGHLEPATDLVPRLVGYEEQPSLEIHVLQVMRGMYTLTRSFKRDESGEETDDIKVAETWRRTGYLNKAGFEIVVLRRPRNHSYGDENLATVAFTCEKVIHEDRFRVTEVVVERLPVELFRERYGAKYPEAATDLIWELRDACSRTHRQLLSQAESFGTRLEKLERLAGAIGF